MQLPEPNVGELLLLISPFFFWGTSMVAMKVSEDFPFGGPVQSIHTSGSVARVFAGPVAAYNTPLRRCSQAVACRGSSALVGTPS